MAYLSKEVVKITLKSIESSRSNISKPVISSISTSKKTRLGCSFSIRAIPSLPEFATPAKVVIGQYFFIKKESFSMLSSWSSMMMIFIKKIYFYNLSSNI